MKMNLCIEYFSCYSKGLVGCWLNSLELQRWVKVGQ